MDSLRGNLLIAAPGLLDPNFWRTVVLVGEYSEEGALGVVLNRTSETPVEDAVPELAVLAGEMGDVHVGGPVQPSAIVVLADFAEPPDPEALVVESVGFLPAEVEPVVDPSVVEIEEVCAGAAAVQNVLLAAHALGLAAMWRTGDAAFDPAVKAFFNLPPTAHLLGFVYLGYPDMAPPKQRRKPAVSLTTWLGWDD